MLPAILDISKPIQYIIAVINQCRGAVMKKLILLVIFSLNFIFFSSPQISHATDITLNNTPVQLYFSPNGGCTHAIVDRIDNAKSEVLIQAYSFTSAPIAKALVNAHKRGIKVEAILDKSQKKEKYTSATFLNNAGIPTYIDDKHAIAHNKIMIIDKETVITGSFNFTKAAEEKNAENLLIIKSKELAKSYIENWTKHKDHSDKY
jgi:phosphatidylserine/phosphatidylglycerophosphate/cardiolipin synthase-like enzyme